MKVDFRATIVNTLDASSTAAPSVTLGEALTQTFVTGTVADAIDRVWSDKGRTITSGNDDPIDVYDLGVIDVGSGAGLDALGQSLAFAEITTIMVHNLSTSSGDIIVGNESTAATFNTPFAGSDTGAVTIKPGGIFFLSSPTNPAYAVADTSNHLLNINAPSGNVTYDIHIAGRSA
jgi:hypothetical protein